MEDIPVMCPDGSPEFLSHHHHHHHYHHDCKSGTFTCMKFWDDYGDDWSVNACNGDEDTYGDHIDHNPGKGWYNAMGSIMVLPGCTAYLFKEHNYEGERKVLRGPAAVYNNHWGDNNPPGPRSFKCRCIQKPISCTPTDGFDVVLTCDNTRGIVPTRCTYSQTIGTRYSSSVTKGMSVSKAVEAEMSLGFE